MFLDILLAISLLGFLLFFLKLLRDVSQNYISLLEAKRDIAIILQTRKEADFKQKERKEKQKLAEEVVDKGTALVENTHSAISGITFGILENIPVVNVPSKVVRKIHDETSKGVYGTIRALNKQIGDVAKDILPSDKDSGASKDLDKK